MTQTVSCIYRAREDADAAAAELRKVGFPDDEIHVVAMAEASDDEIRAATQQAGLRATHAEFYADAVKRGETLVSVPAQFGCAALVSKILHKHNPTETGLPEQGYEQRSWDPAAPLSSKWGWTVLFDNPAPLSAWLGIRVLSTDQPVRKRNADLIDNPAPFSKAIKAPLLTERPAILSSRFGWRVLLTDPAPLSSRLGWPVLSKKPGRFGPRLLSDKPAPFSALLGLKLLSSDPAPLSRLFKWRVLSSDPEHVAARRR